ncbi:hypothetical protein [Streptomyces sp. NPDC002889]|uniref:hypothetical protein n=1 Tax=Streptomyces sp. NPDC002889 TaxID=3364669 RepID=UPI0036BA3171
MGNMPCHFAHLVPRGDDLLYIARFHAGSKLNVDQVQKIAVRVCDRSACVAPAGGGEVVEAQDRGACALVVLL